MVFGHSQMYAVLGDGARASDDSRDVSLDIFAATVCIRKDATAFDAAVPSRPLSVS